MQTLIRIIGILSVLVFGLLAFQNFIAFSFSPSQAKALPGFLLVLFAICAVGGVGLIFLKGWGRWPVGLGSIFVFVVQMIGGRLVIGGSRSPLLLDLLKHVSLLDLAQNVGLTFLLPAVGIFQLVTIALMLVWLWVRGA